MQLILKKITQLSDSELDYYIQDISRLTDIIDSLRSNKIDKKEKTLIKEKFLLTKDKSRLKDSERRSKNGRRLMEKEMRNMARLKKNL